MNPRKTGQGYKERERNQGRSSLVFPLPSRGTESSKPSNSRTLSYSNPFNAANLASSFATRSFRDCTS
jgi:hypothetical protein